MTADELLKYAEVIRAAAALANLKNSPEVAHLKADIDALRADLTATLPTPPDGVAWRDADLDAIVARIEAKGAAEIAALNQGASVSTSAVSTFPIGQNITSLGGDPGDDTP